ncbi:MAG: hypothetical protein Ct9H90mP11_09570 [Acidimicrobiales bacterium]|nr:MAG: hypothetical protein Ct9H90mP11_09570 [Acidimicrobiales bacterium]
MVEINPRIQERRIEIIRAKGEKGDYGYYKRGFFQYFFHWQQY